MESWFLSKHKPWLCGFFICIMMLPIFMVSQIQGVCIEEERKALLEIKASLNDFCYTYDAFCINLLPTWVDHPGNTGDSECCDWERVECNTTTGHVTYLSLGNMIDEDEPDYFDDDDRIWPLNVSLFLHFKELKSLDLSFNHIDDTILSTGVERLSSLKRLETFNLSYNSIGNGLFSSLGVVTSLKILDLSHTGKRTFLTPRTLVSRQARHQNDISMLAALENLVVLNLTESNSYGAFPMQGSEKFSILKSLETLYLGSNQFNETLITSLSVIPSLKQVDLGDNPLSGPFPAEGCKSLSRLKRLETITLQNTALDKGVISCLSFLPSLKNLDLSDSTNLGSSFSMQVGMTELSHLTNLKILSLSDTTFVCLATIEGRKSLSRLKRLETITIIDTYLDKSVISCLSFLPSLKSLDLRHSIYLEGSFPMEELSSFRELEALDLSGCGLQSLTTNGTINNKLVRLMLDGNSFNADVMRSIAAAFPSLRILSLDNSIEVEIPFELPNLPDMEILRLRGNKFNGTLPIEGFCDLKNLRELDLSGNMFSGSLPECFNRLSSLKVFDISSNLFTGTLPPSLISNLTSLEYIDFSHNKFEGSISFSLFSNHTKLKVVAFVSDNDKFVVITEDPKGWIPTFQLKILILSNCNINRPKGSGVPSFLLLQHELQLLDMSHNTLEGHFPNWLIKNNTVLKFFNLRNNSFDGNISMPSLLWNYPMEWLDISGNLVKGRIPSDIQKHFPDICYLNMSRNSLDGVIPSSVGDLRELWVLDLSHNQFTGEVPTGLFTNLSELWILKLSHNSLQGEVLSGNLSLGNMGRRQLDNNLFTGKIGSATGENNNMDLLDISNNLFSGMIPNWIVNSSISLRRELLVRNNRLEGRFPCGTASFSFLDISNNGFSGPIPSCLNWQNVTHLHLGSNRFTGSVPASLGNLTSVLTLDIENNSLSGRIPEVLGKLSNLRILLLGKNKFGGSIPKQLCQLLNASLIDLSGNSLSGSIPPCLKSITVPNYPAFIQNLELGFSIGTSIYYSSASVLDKQYNPYGGENLFATEDVAVFTIKSMPRPYKGNILNYMTGLDLSCNKLTGEIPPELGMLNKIHVLNLSHNQLTGPIPVSFSNLSNIESLDLSSNRLGGKIPSELTKLNFLEVFDVSNNNLSGRLPDLSQTFPSASYEGNPFLCGPLLEKQCTTTPESPIIVPSAEEGTEKWYDINMASFYATWIVFMLGFAAILYTNPYWRRRWLDFVEESMYTCYYFLYDLVRKPRMLFRN